MTLAAAPGIRCKRLGEVLTKSDDWIDLNPLETYTEVTVRLWGKGVVARGQQMGSEIGSKRRMRVRPRQFILSRIDARNGAFGLVPDELDGAVVSNDFPTFDADPEQLVPEYLGWLSRTRSFAEQCQAVSEGSTNRVRLKEDKFYRIEVPLPPVEEQQRIVTKIERLAAKIEKAHEIKSSTVAEVVALIKSARRVLIGDLPANDWKRLGDVVEDIENGWSPACEKHPATSGNWGVIKVGAVSFGTFDPTENKQLPPTLEPKPDYEIKAGDFLMSRANTRELVGACTLVQDAPQKLMLCDKVFRFRFLPEGPIEPAYLDHALKSPALRIQIEAGATGTSPTMKNIGKGKILDLRLPVPAPAEQHRIVTYLNGLQARVDRLKALQEKVSTELEALLPSILDKAFKGEL